MARALAIMVALVPLATSPTADAQPAKKARLGYLSGNPPSDTKEALDAFRAKLRALGYTEGQDLTFLYPAGSPGPRRIP